MSTFGDLLRLARQTPDHLRAKRLARSDYLLIMSLVRIRKSAGLTQEDVAVRLGLSQQAVSKIESYDGDPRLSTLRRYAHAIGALVDHVVEPDVGQLENGGEWQAVAFSTHGTPRTYATRALKRVDLAMAA